MAGSSKLNMDSKGMEFAKLQLEKFGWKEGSGLGRNNAGITEALKPRLKFDASGLGHTQSDEFTYKWWDHAFNKAASSFDVVINDKEGVVVRNEEIGSIKAKKSKVSTTGSFTYGFFHKAGTLNNGDVETVEAPTIKEEKDYSLKLSDEELFKLCGGRTAHKGARHGHRFSGKLARIARQEALLLASMSSSTSSPVSVGETQEIPVESVVTKKKKNKKTKKECEAEVPVLDTAPVDSLERKKKKSKKSEIIPAEVSEVVENIEIENPKPKKKKKRDKEPTEDQVVETKTTEKDHAQDVSETKSKKKKKKKDKAVDENDDVEPPTASPTEPEVQLKKSKKRKRNDTDE